MNKRNTEKERKRLEALLDRARVPQQQRDAIAPVIDNLSWQKAKLDEAREQLQDSDIVCHYNNGGGQEGERESPGFKAYLTLWRGYLAGLEKVIACLPKELQDEAAADTVSTLEKVIQMKRGSA